MTAAAIASRPAEYSGRPTHAVSWWGMSLVCITEGTLFACLLASYFYLGVLNPKWPPAGIEAPKLLLPLIMTGLLLSSSLCYWWAERGIRRDNQGQLRLGIVAAWLLGLAFLVLQTVEYRDKAHHMLPQQHAYASLFYTITGFHGAHVAVGLMMIGYTGVMSWRGHVSGTSHQVVSNVGLYWHFVDAVWLVILSTLYLSPRFY